MQFDNNARSACFQSKADYVVDEEELEGTCGDCRCRSDEELCSLACGDACEACSFSDGIERCAVYASVGDFARIGNKAQFAECVQVTKGPDAGNTLCEANSYNEVGQLDTCKVSINGRECTSCIVDRDENSGEGCRVVDCTNIDGRSVLNTCSYSASGLLESLEWLGGDAGNCGYDWKAMVSPFETKSGDDSGTGVGAIVGIIAAILAVVSGVVVVAFLVLKRRATRGGGQAPSAANGPASGGLKQNASTDPTVHEESSNHPPSPNKHPMVVVAAAPAADVASLTPSGLTHSKKTISKTLADGTVETTTILKTDEGLTTIKATRAPDGTTTKEVTEEMGMDV